MMLSILLPMLLATNHSRTSPVVMIAIDGLRPSELTSAATREWNLPVLRGLSRDGATAAGVRGVLPTLTLPSMMTLVTGTSPGDHGIVNNIRCGAESRDDGGYYWYAKDVKVETLWDAARRRGLRTANVGWTSTVGAAIDRNLPEVWPAPPGARYALEASRSTDGLLTRLEPRPDTATYTMNADRRAAYATALIESYGPQFLTVFFEELDDAEHRTGLDTPEDRQALEHIDHVIGQLITSARKRSPDVTIVVVSDHGFVPATTPIDLVKAFADAGLTGSARPCPAGGSAYVQLIDSTNADVRSRVAAFLAHLQADDAYGIDQLLDREAIRARGGWPGAESMIVFRHGYVASTRPYRGMHGYAPDDPAMYATFIIAGPSVPITGDLGVVDMRDIAPTIATLLGVSLPSATGRSITNHHSSR
jgi:predicted AlkP superfamily pyrophosphatase or phosphodiesterase